MSGLAVVSLREAGAPDILVAYAEHVQGLEIGPDAKRIRRNAAKALLQAHPQLDVWMTRPTPARLADLRRTGAWPFVCWCFLECRLRPDLDLLMAKLPGGLYAGWAERHPCDVERLSVVADRFGWSTNWRRDLIAGLAMICLWNGKELGELTGADFERFGIQLASCPSAGRDTRSHNSARLFSLHQACYELRICDCPPRKAMPRAATLAETLQAVPQPEIRRVSLRYLEVIATTLRPSTVTLRADSLIVFAEYLAAHHPEVIGLDQLDRGHIDGFLVWNHQRPWRGRVARDKPVAPSVSKRTVVDLRAFFDDLAIWGWAQRPPAPLLFATDIPRLDRPLPRALPPDTDRDLMAAVAQLADPFARSGLRILRGTGIRLGELLDLELDCLWNTPTHGTWVKVPLGKLGTERTVPIDDPTLAAFDEWMTTRGPQRALPHPRLDRPADFLFVERGRRLSAYRLRRGLEDAAVVAGLRGRDGAPLRVTPHHLRHTYGTTLINAGMSLQALMALMGHVSAEMTLRYASLASPTVRAAYEAAMSKVRATRTVLVLTPTTTTAIPAQVDWLHAEMLKTRVAHGYCSRHLIAEACPYANICEQCENFVTTTEFLPQLENQLADVKALQNDAQTRGWDTEIARHGRVIASLQTHIRRLRQPADTHNSP